MALGPCHTPYPIWRYGDTVIRLKHDKLRNSICHAFVKFSLLRVSVSDMTQHDTARVPFLQGKFERVKTNRLIFFGKKL